MAATTTTPTTNQGKEVDESGNVVGPLNVPIQLWGGYEYNVDRVLLFYGHTKRTPSQTAADSEIGFDRRMFSNLYPVTITITDPDVLPLILGKPKWASTEHVFQAAKCVNEADKLFIETLSTSNAASYGQGRMKLSNTQKDQLVSLGVPATDFVETTDGKWKRSATGHYPRIADWEEVKPKVMMAALRSKFTASECAAPFAALARSSVNYFFVEHTQNDKIWADGLNGGGTNFLGKLLTQLLIEIRTGTTIGIDRAFLDIPNSAYLKYN